MISQEAIDRIFPKAVAWIETTELLILNGGLPLVPEHRAIASRIGVTNIDRIRVATVDNVPLPNDLKLKQLVEKIKVITQGTDGITFGYGIILKRATATLALLAHELVHVRQYERFGSVSALLTEYLKKILFEPFYPNGPLEREAMALAQQALRDSKPGTLTRMA